MDIILYILIHSSFCINFHAAHMQLKFCQTYLHYTGGGLCLLCSKVKNMDGQEIDSEEYK